MSDKIFAGSIPRLYEEYLVPLIFDAYAEDMAHRVTALDPRSVLETAAGTGAVTRRIAAKLPADARYTVTDLNEPMLAVAQERMRDDARIRWQRADALALPFRDAEFDVVCCQFGAMFFPDRVKGYAEARRVLRPEGAFVFNVWDTITDNEFADDVTEALREMFPDDPPRFLARTPHGYHDEQTIRAELVAAGFTNISIEKKAATSRAEDARTVAIAYCQGTPLRSEIEARNGALLERATDVAANRIARRHGEGRIAGKIQALVITARR